MIKNRIFKVAAVFSLWAVIGFFLWTSWYQHDWMIPQELKFQHFKNNDPDYFFIFRIFNSAFYEDTVIGLTAVVDYCDKNQGSDACYYEKAELFYFEIDLRDYSVLKEIKLPVDKYTLQQYELISFIPKSKSIYWFDRGNQSLNAFDLEEETLRSEKIENATPPKFVYDDLKNITNTQIIGIEDNILMYNMQENFIGAGKLVLYTFDKELKLISENVILELPGSRGEIVYECTNENSDNERCDQTIGSSDLYSVGIDSLEYKDTYILKVVYMSSTTYSSPIKEDFKVEKEQDLYFFPYIEDVLVTPLIISEDLKLESIGSLINYGRHENDFNRMIVQKDRLFSIRTSDHYRLVYKDALSPEAGYWTNMLLDIDRDLQLDLKDKIQNSSVGSASLFTGKNYPWIKINTSPKHDAIYLFQVNSENEVVHRLKQKNYDYTTIAPNDVVYLFDDISAGLKSTVYIQRSAIGELSFYEVRSAVMVLLGIAITFLVFINPSTFLTSIRKQKEKK